MTKRVGARSLRFQLSGIVKNAVLRFYGIPFSRHGLDSSLAPFLPEGQPITLVDVGASDGHFTATVLDHCGVNRALLIEPQPARFAQLRHHFSGPRFALQNCAVSNVTGHAAMAILNADYSSSLLTALPGVGGSGELLDLRVRETIRVPTRTLDELVAEAELPEVIDLLKIDTQGAELLALQGATTMLSRVRLVWAEVSFRALYEGSALFGDVHALLTEGGFRLQSIQDGFRGKDGELLQADALFIAPSVRR